MSVDYKPPVNETCPDIDKAIDLVEDATAAMDDLFKVPDLLEELRSANAALRDWGTELAVELQEANNRINELEDLLAERANELADAYRLIGDLEREVA